MFSQKLIIALLLTASITAQAQKNFTYSPEQPKPGDVITFTYEPAGDIANTILPVEGAMYQMGKKGNKADDIIMEKKGREIYGHYTDRSRNEFCVSRL